MSLSVPTIGLFDSRDTGMTGLKLLPVLLGRASSKWSILSGLISSGCTILHMASIAMLIFALISDGFGKTRLQMGKSTIVVTCCNTLLILCHWIFCTNRTNYYFIHIKHQIWIEMIKIDTMFNRLNMVFDMFYGNYCSRSICLSVRRNTDGKSSIFM